MNMRYISFLILLVTGLLAATPFCLKAQQVVRQGDPIELSIQELGVADGLSQGMIHGLVVDLKGYLWIATKDGLNRYDGNHFHVFRHYPQDPTSIASNHTRSLHVDERGLIWVGTNSNGLDLYNPVNAEFIHFGSGTDITALSKIQSVTAIFSAPGGTIVIWDGTGDQGEVLEPIPGEDAFDLNAWKVKPIDEVYKVPSGMPKLSFNSMLGFAKDGALLYENEQKVYALYKDHVKEYAPPRNYDHLEEYPKVPSFDYFMDTRHNLYCTSTGEKLVYKWDSHSDSFQAWVQFPPDFLLNYRVFVDQQDRIWSNGTWASLYRTDPQRGVFQKASITRYHFAGTQAPDFSVVCEDSNHNLWASTSGNGLVKISSRNDKFIYQYPDLTDNLRNRLVKNGSSFNIDEEFTAADEEQLRSQIMANGVRKHTAYAEDSLHQLWTLTMDAQLNKYLVKVNKEDLSFSSKQIHINSDTRYDFESAIMIDRKGMIWFGFECNGSEAQLFRFHEEDNVQDTFVFPVKVLRNEHAFISDWYVDAQNVFWLGTKQGLFSFNPASGTWKTFDADPLREDALSNGHVLTICPDPQAPTKYLWIGTEGGGLNKLDIATGTFKRYSTANGLPNNVIYAVQSDAHNNLWLSTNLGLCRFDPIKEDTWSFTIKDGLPGNEFNRTEYGKSSNGRLYFSGVEGAVSFDPEDFYKVTTASPIVINRLKLSNKEVIYGEGSGDGLDDAYILSAPLEHSQQLTFPYTERMITLGFSLLDFTNPAGNKYKYKLEGFNDEWIDAGELNEAVFTNLSPGTYKFMVSGCNSNNIWSDPANLQLIIRPPWWATWWFRSFMVVLVGVAIYGFYKYRLQQAMKIQHLRNRIAADLHDEIGSTLSSISLAGTVIQHKLKGQYQEVDGLLNKINNNTQTMMEAMSDIVWAVNTRNDRFDQILHRMRAFAVEILEPKDVLVNFEVNPHVIPLLLDMQQRKNLYLIYKEVIHNAAKYAQCNNVWVNLNYTYGKLVMEVRDDGVGIELDPINKNKLTEGAIETYSAGKGGNGIRNMYQRAMELKGNLEIHSSPGQGTKVTLVFAV